MPKTVDFYYLEDGEDVYVISQADRERLGKTRENLDAECGGHGRLLLIELRPPTAKLDREAKALCLVGDAMIGFRRDEELLPRSQFETFAESWSLAAPAADAKAGLPAWWKEKPSADAFDDLPPNLSDKITAAIERHVRPRSLENPDFFTRLSKDSSPPSQETSPST